MVGVCRFACHGLSAMPRCRPVVCSALSVLGVVSITHGDSLLGLACTPVSASEISVAKRTDHVGAGFEELLRVLAKRVWRFALDIYRADNDFSR